jgi:hypothetical protein
VRGGPVECLGGSPSAPMLIRDPPDRPGRVTPDGRPFRLRVLIGFEPGSFRARIHRSYHSPSRPRPGGGGASLAEAKGPSMGPAFAGSPPLLPIEVPWRYVRTARQGRRLCWISPRAGGLCLTPSPPAIRPPYAWGCILEGRHASCSQKNAFETERSTTELTIAKEPPTTHCHAADRPIHCVWLAGGREGGSGPWSGFPAIPPPLSILPIEAPTAAETVSSDVFAAFDQKSHGSVPLALGAVAWRVLKSTSRSPSCDPGQRCPCCRRCATSTP